LTRRQYWRPSRRRPTLSARLYTVSPGGAA
jgi:hypothetical protein